MPAGFMQLVRSCYLQLVFYREFNENSVASTCTKSLNTNVETLSPPLNQLLDTGLSQEVWEDKSLVISRLIQWIPESIL